MFASINLYVGLGRLYYTVILSVMYCTKLCLNLSRFHFSMNMKIFLILKFRKTIWSELYYILLSFILCQRFISHFSPQESELIPQWNNWELNRWWIHPTVLYISSEHITSPCLTHSFSLLIVGSWIQRKVTAFLFCSSGVSAAILEDNTKPRKPV